MICLNIVTFSTMWNCASVNWNFAMFRLSFEFNLFLHVEGFSIWLWSVTYLWFGCEDWNWVSLRLSIAVYTLSFVVWCWRFSFVIKWSKFFFDLLMLIGDDHCDIAYYDYVVFFCSKFELELFIALIIKLKPCSFLLGYFFGRLNISFPSFTHVIVY